jgi:hypothetical protein
MDDIAGLVPFKTEPKMSIIIDPISKEGYPLVRYDTDRSRFAPIRL